MNIKRIIVQSVPGNKCLVNNPLSVSCQESDIRKAFADKKIFVYGIEVDSVGTALVSVPVPTGSFQF